MEKYVIYVNPDKAEIGITTAERYNDRSLMQYDNTVDLNMPIAEKAVFYGIDEKSFGIRLMENKAMLNGYKIVETIE